MSDLQQLTERLGRRLSRSVAIDNPRMELQSYSPHYGAVDEQRVASILHRHATDEAISWAHSFEISAATTWIRLPGNPDLDMLSRVCVPLRYRQTLVGYLWLIDADGSLGEQELALAVEAGEEAAAVMYRDALFVGLERARERELLRDLLDDDEAVRRQAVAALADELRVDVDRPVIAIVLDRAGEPAAADDGPSPTSPSRTDASSCRPAAACTSSDPITPCWSSRPVATSTPWRWRRGSSSSTDERWARRNRRASVSATRSPARRTRRSPTARP